MSLRRLDDALHCIDHEFRLAGVRLGGRTTVVRLGDGSLVLHSPGPLTDSDARSINDLGPVRTLLAPNLTHHLYLDSARRRWPDAQLLGPTALQAKRPDLRFDGALDGAARSHSFGQALDETLEPIYVGGMPEVDELAFCHAPSGTMILTDLAFHVRAPQPWWTQTMMRVGGGWNRFGPTRLHKSLVKDRPLARAGLEAVLARDFDRVVLAHGEVLERGGRLALRAGYDWLLSDQ